MESANPYLKQISDELSLAWQSEKRKQIDEEIGYLTQSNRLQTTLANRLAATSGIIGLQLVNQEQLVGQVLIVGTDAIVMATTMSNELVVLSAITALTGIGKGSQINELTRSILPSILLKLVNREIVVIEASNQSHVGKLVNVWQDSIDLIQGERLIALPLTRLIRVSFGVTL